MSDDAPTTGTSGPPGGAAPGPSREPDQVGMRETSDMYNALAYVLAGPLTLGPLGWALDHWLGTAFVLPVSLLAGMVLSLYYVWFRYGTR